MMIYLNLSRYSYKNFSPMSYVYFVKYALVF